MATPNSTGKLLKVLESVSEEPGIHRLSTVVSATGLSKTTVHRLLSELVSYGYVKRDIAGMYRPASKFKILAARVGSTDDTKDIRRLLAQLQAQVGKTVHFALRSGDHAVYVDKVEGPDQSIRMASRPGVVVPLHSTALGKAMLSQLPTGAVRDYARRTGLPPATPKTITDVDQLLADRATVRERGYAIDDEENEPMIRCIAAPIGDSNNHAGAVSVSTVAALVDKEELVSYAYPLIHAAAAVGKLL